jgi:anti-anti-sigma factor
MSEKHGSHWLEREDRGEVTIVRLKTPRALDEDLIRSIFDPIYSLVRDVGRHKVVLNMAAVSYLPSLALGKMVMLNRKTQAALGGLALCHLSPAVREILTSTHLDQLFQIHETEEDALQSLQGAAGQPEE